MSDRLYAIAQPFTRLRVVGASQAFLTKDALSQIVATTMTNLEQYVGGEALKNEVKAS